MKKEILISYAKMPTFRHKVDRALSTVEAAFKKIPRGKSYVAFSGGKDSTVVFDLVRTIEPKICGIWSDDEFWLPETGDYMQRLRESGAKIRQIQERAVHTGWFVSHADCKTGIVAGEYEGTFMGLRAQENRYRRIFLRKYGLLYQTNAQQWLCNPIAWWKIEDVWAYIFSHDLDYNKAYDRLSQIGVPLELQRIGPFATERALGYGQIAILKKGWPGEYQRFCVRFPQVTRYV